MPSVGAPYASVRLADGTIVELLVVVSSDVNTLWVGLLGDDVSIIGRVLSVDLAHRRGWVSRADAICIGVVDRCGMRPGQVQGKRNRKPR